MVPSHQAIQVGEGEGGGGGEGEGWWEERGFWTCDFEFLIN